MKHTTDFTLRAWALGLLLTGVAFSCAKPLPPVDPTEPTGQGELVQVHFSVKDIDTKSTVTVGEDAIHRWTVFAFDNQSGWHRYSSSDSDADVEMQLRAGQTYTLYALANYPSSGTGALNPAGISSPSQLSSKVASLSDVAVGSLPMYGTATMTPGPTTYVPGSNPPEVVPEGKAIEVRRIVSRVDAANIALDFSSKPSLLSKTVTLRHIYVTNAYRTTTYAEDYSFANLSATRSAWYNPAGWHRYEAFDAATDAITCDRNINHVLTPSTPYATWHSFYVFANATPKASDSRADAWTKRCTRLVLEVTFDSDTYYYAIDIPGMERNRIYSAASIILKDTGSRDPEAIDMDPSAIDVTFSVSAGWEPTPYEVSENS